MGGWAGGKAAGGNYEYDPATDKWTKKKPMPRPAHHAAMAVANGKIYVIGGFIAPTTTAVPLGAAWQPIDDVWEYDPAADSWKSLAPLPSRRGSALAVEVGGKIYTIGGVSTVPGVQGFVLHGLRSCPGSHHQRRVRSRHQQVGEPHTDGSRAQSRIRRCRQREDLPHRRPHRPRVHPDRHQHGCGGGVQSGERLVECSEERMPYARSGGAWGTDGRLIYVAGGEITTNGMVGAFNGIQAYNPAINAWFTLPPMPMPRHGLAGAVIGDRFHLVSGMIQSAGALVFQDPSLHTHTANHDVLELKFGAPPAKPAKNEEGAPSGAAKQVSIHTGGGPPPVVRKISPSASGTPLSVLEGRSPPVRGRVPGVRRSPTPATTSTALKAR